MTNLPDTSWHSQYSSWYFTLTNLSFTYHMSYLLLLNMKKILEMIHQISVNIIIQPRMKKVNHYPSTLLLPWLISQIHPVTKSVLLIIFCSHKPIIQLSHVIFTLYEWRWYYYVMFLPPDFLLRSISFNASVNAMNCTPVNVHRIIQWSRGDKRPQFQPLFQTIKYNHSSL
jgi:hypothetical protein